MKITIKGREFDAEMPPLDLREDIVYSYGTKYRANPRSLPLQRVRAAMVALCVPEVAFSVRHITTSPREDLFVYGAEVYNALREKGWAAADLIEAANALLPPLMAQTFPREKEVEAARGNSDGGG